MLNDFTGISSPQQENQHPAEMKLHQHENCNAFRENQRAINPNFNETSISLKLWFNPL